MQQHLFASTADRSFRWSTVTHFLEPLLDPRITVAQKILAPYSLAIFLGEAYSMQTPPHFVTHHALRSDELTLEGRQRLPKG
jgi:hypothetical protein